MRPEASGLKGPALCWERPSSPQGSLAEGSGLLWGWARAPLSPAPWVLSPECPLSRIVGPSATCGSTWSRLASPWKFWASRSLLHAVEFSEASQPQNLGRSPSRRLGFQGDHIWEPRRRCVGEADSRILNMGSASLSPELGHPGDRAAMEGAGQPCLAVCGHSGVGRADGVGVLGACWGLTQVCLLCSPHRTGGWGGWGQPPALGTPLPAAFAR